jgi:glycosyltransferase involved in cell wall biosynthesis
MNINNTNKNTLQVVMIDSLVGNDYSLGLCSGLQSQGINVQLVVPENRKIEGSENITFKKWLPSKKQNNLRLFKLLKYLIYFIKILYTVIVKRNVVLHYQFFRFRFEPLFLLLLKFLKVRLALTAHNVLPHEKTKFDYALKSIAYKAANIIIVHSSFIKKKLLGSFNVSENKIKIIPHGNFDRYLPSELPLKKDSRNLFNLTDADNTLLFFGRIREYKGLGLLLDALSIVQTKVDNAPKLIIAGSPQTDNLKKKYFEKINDLALNSNVIFHPYFIPSEKIADYFNAADVVVLPYKSIDHSGIIHLAYTFEKPVIATRVGDFSEIIKNGETGYILEENNVEYLAQIIIEVFKDKDKLASMGKVAGQLNKTKYSWNSIAQLTIQEYLQI